MQIHRRFAKNAVANLGRGSAAALVALLLPPVLVRHMTPASYAVWVLVLQTAAYIGYLNFGLQTAIGRYVAYANEKKDVEQRDSVFSTAFVGLCCAALVSLVCLAAAILAAPTVFPSVPSPLVPQMRLALLIVGLAMAVELPASACNGVFIGMERYEIPALTVGGARLVSAFGVIAAALAGRSLVVMAAVIASANLLSYLAQFLALRRIAPDVRFRAELSSALHGRDLSGYCFGLDHHVVLDAAGYRLRSCAGGPLRVLRGHTLLGRCQYDHLHSGLLSRSSTSSCRMLPRCTPAKKTRRWAGSLSPPPALACFS